MSDDLGGLRCMACGGRQATRTMLDLPDCDRAYRVECPCGRGHTLKMRWIREEETDGE